MDIPRLKVLKIILNQDPTLSLERALKQTFPDLSYGVVLAHLRSRYDRIKAHSIKEAVLADDRL